MSEELYYIDFEGKKTYFNFQLNVKTAEPSNPNSLIIIINNGCQITLE